MTTIKIPNGGNIYFVCILIARILYILVAEHILHNVDELFNESALNETILS